MAQVEPYKFQEYPKWINSSKAKARVLVNSKEEEVGHDPVPDAVVAAAPLAVVEAPKLLEYPKWVKSKKDGKDLIVQSAVEEAEHLQLQAVVVPPANPLTITVDASVAEPAAIDVAVVPDPDSKVTSLAKRKKPKA
jgi:hypothetical protein